MNVRRMDGPAVIELLTIAAANVAPAPGRKAWNCGWCLPEYRRSNEAAISRSDGPLTLTAEGLTAFEDAVGILLRESAVRSRWDPKELWGIVVSMLAEASRASNPEQYVRTAVARLQSTGPALTIMLLANVSWEGGPLRLGDVVLGLADDEFLALVNSVAGERVGVAEDAARTWIEAEVDPRLDDGGGSRPVAVACWTVAQHELAHREAETRLRNVLELSTLLEFDLAGRGVYRRGPTNRPGIRGLTLDRGALERGVWGATRLELASRSLCLSADFPSRLPRRWFSSEPLPLGSMLAEGDLKNAVASCLREDPVCNRVRVAARWFSEAQYAIDEDDAALALGVAMDALLTGKRSLSGSVMADRFALLDVDYPLARKGRVKDYLEYYGVRSSVAHGGRSGRLQEDDFLKRFFAAVRWCALRLIELRDEFPPMSDQDIDDLFNDLRWGVQVWP